MPTSTLDAATTAVTDSSDWALTALPLLAPLDSSLRCQICKEYYTTPMITRCGHTFCSLCIRRYLNQTAACPCCRKDVEAAHLMKNLTAEEAVEAFRQARDPLMQVALGRQRAASSNGSGDTEVAEEEREEEDGAAWRRYARRRRKRESRQTSVQTIKIDCQEPHYSGGPPSSFSSPSTTMTFLHATKSNSRRSAARTPPPLDEPCFTCPVCQSNIFKTERAVEAHVGGCLERESRREQEMEQRQVASRLQSETLTMTTTTTTTTRATRTKMMEATAAAPSSQRQLRSSRRATGDPPPVPERMSMSKPFYHGMKDRALRDLLAKDRLATHGPRKLLEERHKEWINIWNADCDARVHRPVEELRKDLREWERVQSRSQNPFHGGAAAAVGGMSESDRGTLDRSNSNITWKKNWSARHKDAFSSLVAEARSRVMKQKLANNAAVGDADAGQASASLPATELQEATYLPARENSVLPVINPVDGQGLERKPDAIEWGIPATDHEESLSEEETNKVPASSQCILKQDSSWNMRAAQYDIEEREGQPLRKKFMQARETIDDTESLGRSELKRKFEVVE